MAKIFPGNGGMKPIMIVPKGTMTEKNIKLLNDNGICTVEATNPALCKFVDPIPSAGQRGKIEEAAIGLSKKILSKDAFIRAATHTSSGSSFRDLISHQNVITLYLDCLVAGTSLDPNPSQEEIEQRYFNDEKRGELQRLARGEAREERKKIRDEKAKKEAKSKVAEKKIQAGAIDIDLSKKNL